MKSIVKHAGGRPTKYIPDIVFPIIDEYLESCGRENTELPTVEGLAEKLGIVKDTIYQWSEKYPEFSDYLKKVADKQRNQLINDGMYGGKEVNASMAIFLLKAIHGMKDGSQPSVNIQEAKILVLPPELIGKYDISQNTERGGPEQGEISGS